jgi:Rps23 Pro-64 3,4-dihydroxylase Tpa1-like proline 4-hydroxylase
MKITKELIHNSNSNIYGSWIDDNQLLEELSIKFNNVDPFEHIIIPSFLKEEIANKVSNEYPTKLKDYHKYNNPLEIKYAYDDISNMSDDLKNIFYSLCSENILSRLKIITKNDKLEYDPTCHGGGLHLHPNNGRLHMHLDYEKHPILENKQRYLNIILYLSKDWKQEWGGHTELWNEDMSECKIKSNVEFNTALIFKTTEKSWHGLPEPIKCPENVYRKTLAFYYLIPLENNPTKIKQGENYKKGSDDSGFRTKAVFSKRPKDPYDPLIKKLYEIRPFRRITEEDLIN